MQKHRPNTNLNCGSSSIIKLFGPNTKLNPEPTYNMDQKLKTKPWTTTQLY